MVFSCRKRRNDVLLVAAFGFFYLGLFSPTTTLFAEGKIECETTSECETIFRIGSICDKDGYCTNPFQKGCLRSYLDNDEISFPLLPNHDDKNKKNKLRSCNSQDGEDAETMGLCETTPFPETYTEIRISPQNWESAMFYAWIMQIVLSELVDVPVSIDTGVGVGNLNFYDPDSSFAYNRVANNFDGLYKANEVGGDCLNVNTTEETCAHLLPDLWQGNRDVDEDQIERDGNGMVGHVGWYIPNYLVQEEPSLASHWGLRGDENRKKLAEIFKRPTTWRDYCEEVSTTNCTVDDSVASRFPEDENEAGMYFSSDQFTGHFRATDKNNCTANPNTCTGHIIDYPCTWSAYTYSQLYWNDIPLESEINYSYSGMIQIMKAANATREAAMFVWWYPDAIIERYDYFQVKLTKTTTECLVNRPEPKPNRCEASEEELIGLEIGSCGYNTHPFEKVYATSLREKTIEVPEALRSPAYETLRNLRVSDIDISEMMMDWVSKGVDTYGYDPREAVCSWVAKSVANENMKRNLLRFIPVGYPREIQESSYSEPYLYGAIAFAILVIILIIATLVAIAYYRKSRIMRSAQHHFSNQFCFGYLLVAIGAIVHTLVPTKISCVTRIWLVSVGYTLGLVPLLIKVAAINRVMGSAKRMKRIIIPQSHLHGYSAGAVVVIIIYLIIWTVIDPPSAIEEPTLVSESIVEVRMACSSNAEAWYGGAILWQGVFIFGAALLSYQSKDLRADFNESREIGNMAYSHFLFIVCRVLVWLIPSEAMAPNEQEGIYSYLLSADSLLAVLLYFGPKMWSLAVLGDTDRRGFGSTTISGLNGLDIISRRLSLRRQSAPGNVQQRPSMQAVRVIFEGENSTRNGTTTTSRDVSRFSSAMVPGIDDDHCLCEENEEADAIPCRSS